MCGFVARFGAVTSDARGRFDNAMTSINYRGPDRSRTLVLENAILGTSACQSSILTIEVISRLAKRAFTCFITAKFTTMNC